VSCKRVDMSEQQFYVRDILKVRSIKSRNNRTVRQYLVAWDVRSCLSVFATLSHLRPLCHTILLNCDILLTDRVSQKRTTRGNPPKTYPAT
jgi:hypothetical protein